MAVVLDTDVFSYIFKKDTRAALYRPHLVGQLLILSFMTIAEVERWALGHNWGARRRQQFEQYLKRYVVQQSSPEMCSRWAEATDSAARAGKPIAAADAWIAATALLKGVPLVTNNARDYAGVAGLTIITESGKP